MTGGLPGERDVSISSRRLFDERVLRKAGPLRNRSLAAFMGGGALVGSAADLIGGILKDATIEVWRECRAADKERRTQMLGQLDGLKWRSFGEVPALG